MSVEGAGELAFQPFQLLHEPGAATRWQKEGIGGRPKAAADPEPAKGLRERLVGQRRQTPGKKVPPAGEQLHRRTPQQDCAILARLVTASREPVVSHGERWWR